MMKAVVPMTSAWPAYFSMTLWLNLYIVIICLHLYYRLRFVLRLCYSRPWLCISCLTTTCCSSVSLWQSSLNSLRLTISFIPNMSLKCIIVSNCYSYILSYTIRVRYVNAIHAILYAGPWNSWNLGRDPSSVPRWGLVLVCWSLGYDPENGCGAGQKKRVLLMAVDGVYIVATQNIHIHNYFLNITWH